METDDPASKTTVKEHTRAKKKKTTRDERYAGQYILYDISNMEMVESVQVNVSPNNLLFKYEWVHDCTKVKETFINRLLEL